MAASLTLLAIALQLILVDFYSHFANATLTVRPTDTVVRVNHTTYFNCSTSDRTMNPNVLLWYHYPLNSASREDVFDEGVITYEYMSRFKIEMDLSMGVFNLVAVKPSLADAGRYECQDGVGQGDRASAELIILDGNPVCESNMPTDGVVGPNSCGLKPDDLSLTCYIASYHGNTPPMLAWKKLSDEGSSSLPPCQSSLSCNVTQRGDEISNDQSFVCHTTKSMQQYGCSIGPVKVKYAMSWTESKGDVCSSNTTQSCTYKWYNAKNETVSKDAKLQTTDPGEYKCEAQCEMNRQNEMCKFIAMPVHTVVSPDPASDAQSALIAIPIIIGVIALIILIIIIVILCLYKHKKITNCFKESDSGNRVPVDKVQPPSSTREIPLDQLTCTNETEELIKKTSSSASAPDHEDNSQIEPSADISSLLIIKNQDMVDTLTINDHFIDRGTSGAIYGPFRWNDKKCAVKQIMFSPDEVTKDMEKNILQKSNVCIKLDHKNVLKVFDVWLRPPALYIVMEYAEGKSLDKILRPRDDKPPYPPFPLEIIINWALQIAEGMNYLHFNGLVHRNLKTAHVLVMKSPDVLPQEQKLKIGSYTPIKEHDHATVMSNRGTLAWMAPEYIRGEPFSKLSDVWSYGITVFEILTRDVPYKEMRKETDIVRAAIIKTLMPTIPTSCPQPLKDLLTNCWNYEVEKRPGFTKICDDLRKRGIWEPYVTCST